MNALLAYLELPEGTFEFAHGWMIWLLPLPLLMLALPTIKHRQEALYFPLFEQILALKKEKASTRVQVKRRSVFQLVVISLTWILLIISAAGPQIVGEPEKQIKTARSFLLNVDLSLSMLSRDWKDEQGNPATRWDAVKSVMSEFIERREGDRMGLVLFGSQAYLQSPLTTDLNVVEALLNEAEIGMAGGKTAMGNAIGKAVELFKRDSIQKKVMLLVSDGQDSGSELNPLQAARLAAIDGVTIYTLGIGTTSGVTYELDEQTLTAIAEETGGRYFLATDLEMLDDVCATLDELEPIEYESEAYIPTVSLFYIPLAIALILVIGYHSIAALSSVIRTLVIAQQTSQKT